MKSRRCRSDLQDYYNQLYIGALLDERVFDIQNKGGSGHCDFLYKQGALDALDFIPAGSMRYVGGHYYDQSVCERGRTLAEVEAENEFMNSLVDEVNVPGELL